MTYYLLHTYAAMFSSVGQSVTSGGGERERERERERGGGDRSSG